ncbi:MAG: ribonuclease HII, partial [Campylobacterales bacterium]
MTSSLFGPGDLACDYLCGIDEAGRGPLAGPLVVAGVILLEPIDGLADSKKLTPKARQKLLPIIKKHPHHIVTIDAATIDAKGLSLSLRYTLEEIRDHLDARSYLFDGPTTFGAKGITTLVKADTHIPAVMAASILAKTTRDALMLELDALYPGYGFAQHKGYGT